MLWSLSSRSWIKINTLSALLSISPLVPLRPPDLVFQFPWEVCAISYADVLGRDVDLKPDAVDVT